MLGDFGFTEKARWLRWLWPSLQLCSLSIERGRRDRQSAEKRDTRKDVGPKLGDSELFGAIRAAPWDARHCSQCVRLFPLGVIKSSRLGYNLSLWCDVRQPFWCLRPFYNECICDHMCVVAFFSSGGCFCSTGSCRCDGIGAVKAIPLQAKSLHKGCRVLLTPHTEKNSASLCKSKSVRGKRVGKMPIPVSFPESEQARLSTGSSQTLGASAPTWKTSGASTAT